MVDSVPVLTASNIDQIHQNYLGPVDLGKQCQSSEQCQVKNPNSACYAEKHFDDWRCKCTDGFVEKDGKCGTNSEYLKTIQNPYKRCASLNQVYVLVLDRCVDRSQMPYYAHRGGRGGGGRGGGGRGGGKGRGGGGWSFNRRRGGGFSSSGGKRNAANFVRSNFFNISTLSLISCYLAYFVSTKHL